MCHERYIFFIGGQKKWLIKLQTLASLAVLVQLNALLKLSPRETASM